VEFIRPTAAIPSGALAEASTTVRHLILARSLRDFANGFVAVLLPFYLTALGLSPFEIGVVASGALVGSAFLTFCAGLFGDGRDYRQLLLGAAGLMIATGVAFSMVDAYSVILVVAFAGTVNPSAGSVSLFVPLEQAVLTREFPVAGRARMFASYKLIGALAGAAGALAAATPDLLTQIGFGRMAALKAMFVLYALIGLAGAFVYARIPARPHVPQERPVAALGPSGDVGYKLAALSGLDAFAGGFVVQSLLALWLFERFDISLTAAGLFFAWSGILSAFSLPLAAWLSRRINPIGALVFAHIPSSILLMLAAVAPTLSIVLFLLLIRAAFSQMDASGRSSCVTAAMTLSGRTAVASFTSVSRSLAASASPVLAGALLASSSRGWPLVICGLLSIVYDLLLLRLLRRLKPLEKL
jgi:MFS family permease